MHILYSVVYAKKLQERYQFNLIESVQLGLDTHAGLNVRSNKTPSGWGKLGLAYTWIRPY